MDVNRTADRSMNNCVKARILDAGGCGYSNGVIERRILGSLARKWPWYEFMWYHFVPHLFIYRLETNKSLFLHTNFCGIFNATLFKEVAAQSNRHVSRITWTTWICSQYNFQLRLVWHPVRNKMEGLVRNDRKRNTGKRGRGSWKDEKTVRMANFI
jgi:hypothetical protein